MTEFIVTVAITSIAVEETELVLAAIASFAESNLSVRVTSDAETDEIEIAATSVSHLHAGIDRLNRQCNAKIAVSKPKIAYRETIARSASFDSKFVRQTCGPGHYGHAIGRLEPTDVPFAFENRIVGDSIPREFISACEKGFRNATVKGLLGGYPVTGVKVILEDGSYHPIDSRSLSFQIAAHKGFRDAYLNADPMLLEPIMRVEITAPQTAIESVLRDLHSRRSNVPEVENRGDRSFVRAEVPLSELWETSPQMSFLSADTAFSMEFSHYHPVPPDLQQQILKG